MKNRSSVVLGASLVATGLLAGCGDATQAAVAAPAPAPVVAVAPVAPAAPVAPVAPAGDPFEPAMATATIKVKATLKGTCPPLRPIKFDADAECAKLHGEAVSEQSIVVKEGKLANVIAYVAKGAEKWTCKAPAEAIVLDQKGCMYQPHVFTVQVNQPITIKNSDPTLHNIHAVPKKNDEFNKSQSKGAADLTEKFTKEEIPVRVKCDIHGWMLAWAGVFSHPFHGVTADDGTVSIKVPPGEFEVSAWHEAEAKIGKAAPQKVTVAAGETKEIEFVYEVK